MKRVSSPDPIQGELRRLFLPERNRAVLGTVWLWIVPLLLVCGCLKSEPRADLVILNGAEPESLDPAVITGQPDLRVVGALFHGLARHHPETGEPIPALAESWERSSDLRTYLFRLRTNAVWSTGEPITAKDFVYSWRRVLDPRNAAEYAGQLFSLVNAEAFNTGKIKDASLVGVRALDPHLLRVDLHSPIPFFLDLCTFQTLAVVPRKAIERYGDSWLKRPPVPVSGPYQLEAWRPNDKVRLRRNPRYWDAANTRTELVDILPTSSPSAALNLFETGAADIVWDKTLIPSELLDVLRNRTTYHSFDYMASYFVRVNVTRKPFTDPRVRKALAMAVDKKRIVERITKGGEKWATHHTPPGIANYKPPEGLSYDPEAARRLLAEAGFPEGKGFPVFNYLYNATAGGGAKTDEKIAVELQSMWREHLGINAELRPMENKVYLATQRALDYDTCRSSWIGDYNDANTFLDMFTSNNGNNRTGWTNERFDTLVQQANQQTDLTARERCFQEAEILLVREELPIIPLYFYVGIYSFDPEKIGGIYPNLIDEHPIEAIWRKDRQPALAKGD